MSIVGQVALVTGSSRGIGRAAAVALARAGARVIVNFAGSEGAARETVEQILHEGGEAFAIKADVAAQDQVETMIQQTLDRMGRIDILVNNAGITRDNLLMRMKPEEWDQVINTNLKGVYNCTRSVIRPMLKQKSGRIINVTSVIGIIGNAGQANYAAAKAGIIGFTKSMAKELGSRGILVNAVAPGYISTDMTAQLPENARQELLQNIPLARLGNPEDVADVIAFLASPAARYITGQVLHVDGGMVM
ncbi:MAG: 3-oxoacyl-[acyl-carrier-protein] reductase [Bacillota bacterium]